MSTKSPFHKAAGSGFSRRAFLLGVAAPLLAACSSDSGSDTSQLEKMVGHSLGLVGGGSDISLDDVTGVPYASIGVRIGNGPQAMLVLATHVDGSTVWTSAAHMALDLRYGRIMRTSGFAHDLGLTAFEGVDPLAQGIGRLPAQSTASRRIDLPDRNIFQALVRSTLVRQEATRIDILGTPVNVVHATEHCICAAPKWEFTNEYWGDAKAGTMWRSIQFVHPDLAALEIQTFRQERA